MSEPKIYTKNYVNADDTYETAGGAATIANIYDRDKDTQWSSVGYDADVDQAVLSVAFREGTTTVERTFDTIMLINHNLLAYVIQYFNGSIWVTLATETADDTQEATVISFAAVTAGTIRLLLTNTLVPDSEKMIGELICAELLLDVGADMASYAVAYRQKAKSLTMGDGSLHQALTFWTSTRSEKYEAKVGFENISAAILASLAAIKESGDPFLWYPESETRPDEIFWVHWTSPLSWKYSTFYKAAGFSLALDLKEV